MATGTGCSRCNRSVPHDIGFAKPMLGYLCSRSPRSDDGQTGLDYATAFAVQTRSWSLGLLRGLLLPALFLPIKVLCLLRKVQNQ